MYANIIYLCLKFTFKKVGKMLINYFQVLPSCKCKILFLENPKLVYPRYLGDFYYRETMILQSIKQPATIRNWATFCGYRPC